MLPNPSAGNMLTVYGRVFDNAPRPPLSRSVGLTAATRETTRTWSSPASGPSLSDVCRMLASTVYNIAIRSPASLDEISEDQLQKKLDGNRRVFRFIGADIFIYQEKYWFERNIVCPEKN